MTTNPLPDPTNPNDVATYRNHLEHHYTETMWEPITAFLNNVLNTAVKALDAPITLTADGRPAPPKPLAWTTVRRRWYDTIRAIARLEPALSDRSTQTLLEESTLPADAYTDVQDIMRQATLEGWSETKTKRTLSKRLIPHRRKDETTNSYANRIRTAARTTATANLGRWMDAELARTGASYKRWVTVGDSRVRAAHAAADGQEVPLGSPFVVDGEMLEYPGDPHGSAGNVINCRCVMVAGVEPGGSYAPRRVLDEADGLEDLPDDDYDGLFTGADDGTDPAGWSVWAARRAGTGRGQGRYSARDGAAEGEHRAAGSDKGVRRRDDTG